MFVIVMAFVLVFAFTATALAATLVDNATWSSGTCSNYFITSDCVQKSSTSNWSLVNIGLYTLSFARTATNDYLLFQPRANGTLIGPQNHIHTLSSPDYEERVSVIYDAYKGYGNIYLKITNPNSGNNMTSGGFWEGYIR